MHSTLLQMTLDAGNEVGPRKIKYCVWACCWFLCWKPEQIRESRRDTQALVTIIAFNSVKRF